MMVVPSLKTQFYATYLPRQAWSLPDSVMYYVAKNPKSPKNTQTWKNIDLKNISSKTWINDSLVIHATTDIDNLAFSIVTKIYKCDAKYLTLYDQVFTFDEFLFLGSAVEQLALYRSIVRDEDGREVAFETLVECLPNLKNCHCSFVAASKNASKNTLKEFWKIPHLLTLDSLSFGNITEEFNIDNFVIFIKQNKNTRIQLYFADTISEAYKNRLEIIIDEIIKTENHDYKPPYISFRGLDEEKDFNLGNLAL
uniref:Uncharacterized protein n=1 Tax=Panagrolaimus sp. ES5 TaxID=591445 RepID=A0AC34FMS1_9BILA